MIEKMKTLKYLFLSALAILAFAACNKDKTNNTTPSGDGGNGNTPPADEFVPAVKIDGVFTDWAGVTNELTQEGGPVFSFKATYDEKYVYFYIKRNLNEELFPPAGNGYFYICMETDENPATGIVSGTGDANKVNGQWLVPEYGIDSWFFVYLFTSTGSGEDIQLAVADGPTGGDSYPENFIANIASAGKIDIVNEKMEIEVRAKREDMLVQTGKTVKIHTWGNKSASNLQKTPLTIKIEK